MNRFSFIAIIIFGLISWSGIIDGNSSTKDSGSGFIEITVQSNINRLIFNYNLTGNCIISSGAAKTKYDYDTSGLKISVPIRDFECRNQSVYEDFLRLLKADQFPYLEIDVPQYQAFNVSENETSVLEKEIAITVTGISKKYDIICRIEKNGAQNEILYGIAQIRFTDFEIKPPVKFSGLVKVKDEIIVKFGFCIQNNVEAIKSI